jgi:hypothetical protein
MSIDPKKKAKIKRALDYSKNKDIFVLKELDRLDGLEEKINSIKPEQGLAGPKGDKGDPGKNGEKGRDGLTPDTNQIVTKATERAIQVIKPLIPNIEEIENDLPQLGTEIRNGLELLSGNERLDKSAIKGIDDYDEIAKLAKQPKVIGGGCGSIARNFYQLFDVPQNYSGQSGKSLKVKNTEDGLEFGTDNSGVPYTGATQDLNLGEHSLITTLGGTVTRVGDYISVITLSSGRTLTVTRNADNYISSITDGTNTWTFIRDVDNKLTSWTV